MALRGMDTHQSNTPPLVAREVASLRERLWDAGFRPVAIYNYDSRKTHSPGKAPKGEEWTERNRRDPPHDAVAAVDLDAINTGILCDGLRAIDIDVDNITMATSIRNRAMERFGEAPLRVRANTGRCLLLYRAAEGQPGKRAVAGTFGKVEVLGKGQQFVAFGVHPSGAPLEWIGEHPGEICANQLPAVTEQALTEFLAACAETIGAKPEQRPTDRASPQTSRHGLRGDTLQVVAALSAIPNDGPADWEAWNRIGMATWTATGGSAGGLAAWHAWSEQHPSYDATEVDRRWAHFAVSPPTAIGAGTLFHLARGARSDPPLPSEDDYGAGALPEGEAPHPQAAEQQRSKGGQAASPNEDDDAQPWRPIDVPALRAAEVPVRRWVVPEWLPRRVVTLNYADGGIGKTLLALQLMAATALGSRWCGLPVEPCASLGLFSEDDKDEIHIRLAAIRAHYGAEWDDLADMVPVDATGQDNTLLRFTANGRMEISPRFHVLRQHALDISAKLVVIDTAATTFGGNENDRGQVTAFVGALLTGLAQDIDGAVLLNAHPSLSGMASGDLRSGSTGWNNSCRSRWGMSRPADESGKPILDSPERVLTKRKANASTTGDTITLTWRDGVFAAPESSYGRPGDRKDAAERAFLDALNAAAGAGFHVSDNQRAGNYAPRKLANTPECADFKIPELREAMANLLRRNIIHVTTYTKNYQTHECLAETTR